MSQSQEILFESNKITIYHNEGNITFNYNDFVYELTSTPYEPCLYIQLDGKTIRIIHNSFSVDEIINSATNGNAISSITGKDYDILAICDVLTRTIDLDIFETDLSFIEKQFNFTELLDDPFYKEYAKYDEAVFYYYILQPNTNTHSQIDHQNSVLFAIQKLQNKLKHDYEIDIKYNQERMKAELINTGAFFDLSLESQNGKKSYAELFLNPPHGSSYTIEDFKHLNNLLFPNGLNQLEIYEWSTDWSNFFDDGKEWWGTLCVSIYDKSLNRFVVMLASETD